MKREFLINVTILILVNILIKPVYILLIETRVQDTLGPNTYGLYFAIFNFVYILQIIADLGIQNYNSRTIAKNPTLLPKVLPDILGVKMLLTLVFLLVGLVFAAFFGYLSASGWIFGGISLNLILLSFILYFRTNIAATGHYRLDSIISVADKFILILILSCLLFMPRYSDSFTIYSFIFAQTVSLAIVFCVVALINFRLAGFILISFSLGYAKNLLRQSLPFSLVIVLMSLYMRMDGFMLDRLLDDQAYQAGVYAAAFRIYDAFNMIGYLFAVLLLPMFASLLDKKTELSALMRSSHNLMLAIATVLVTGGILFRQQIMFFLYPLHADPYYGELLGLLLLSFFAISISYIYGTFLTAGKKLGSLNRLLFAGVAINLMLNLLMIPSMGAKGAAYATVFTQFFVLAGQYLLSMHELKPGISNLLFFKRTGFVLLSALLGIVFYRISPDWNWMILFIIFECLLISLAALFGLINPMDLRKQRS